MTELGLQTNQKHTVMCVFVLQKNRLFVKNYFMSFVCIYIIICIIFAIICGFHYIFSIKSIKFCDFLNISNLTEFNFSITKTSHKLLNKSHCSQIAKQLFKKKNNLICLSQLYLHKEYITTLAKFVDFKINNSTKTFRSQSNKIYIEEVTKFCLSKTISHKTPLVYKTLNNLSTKNKIQQKELKVFKLVLTKYIIERLFQIKRQCDKLVKIISKSKTANSISFYDNSLYFYTQIYGICKHNKNSTTLILKHNINTNYCINRFLKHISNLNREVCMLVCYLVQMFK